MSNTPRTDVKHKTYLLVGWKHGFGEGIIDEFADFARELERENNKLRKELIANTSLNKKP